MELSQDRKENVVVKKVSSYAVKIKGFNKILEPTVTIYRDALAYLISIVDSEWESVSKIDGNQYQQKFVESLVHSTTGKAGKTGNVAKYHEFDLKFYKFPSYLRRSTITDAIGVVSSYRSNLENWHKQGQHGRAPKLSLKHYKFPTFFKKEQFKREDDGTAYSATIKIYRNNDWVWLPITFKKSDVDYIQHHMVNRKENAPVLEKRGRHYFLRFSFEKQVKLENTAQIILSVDLNLNTNAVATAMRTDGTILGRHFFNFPKEKDQLWTNLNRIKRNQQSGHKENKMLWALVKGQNQSIAEMTARFIVDTAVYYSADVIVMEHLDTSGKKKGSKKQRLHHWRHAAVWDLVLNKAHHLSIRVSSVNAWGTSRLAYDGSGRVLRGKEIDMPYGVCQFQTGKVYNADLNASYNIGARYLIRQILKSLSEKKRLAVLAKVPKLSKRSTCTLSDLISLNSVLGGVCSVKATG
jgi:IS605 OrfB family transposase